MITFLFFFTILFWIFINHRNPKSVNKYISLCAILYFIIIGFRSEVIYGDTFGYVYYFKQLKYFSLSEILELWEKDRFFWIVSYYLSCLLDGNYIIWLSLIAFIVIYPITKLIRRYSVEPMFSFVLFVYLGLMFFFMAGLRQTVSISFILMGVLVLLDDNCSTKKKYILYSVYVLIAYLFHGSSFVAIFALLFVNKPLDRKALLMYFGVVLLCFLAGRYMMSNVISYMGQYDERYLGYGENMHGATITYFLQQFVLVGPSLYFLRKRYNDKEISLLFHFSIIGLICVSLSPIVAEMFRLSYFFSWANLLLFPYAIQEMRKYDKTYPLIFLMFFIILVVFIFGINDYYFFFEDVAHIERQFDISQYQI